VLLVDDIADTVQTATAVREDVLRTFSIPDGSVNLCFLLEKLLDNPAEDIKRLKQALRPEYVGFRIPDVWVAGYGIDAGEDFRSLPVVIRVDESYY
jgi:hypoxanthine phosphoribosyltransferase